MALKRSKLGRTGLEVTELCYGTLVLGALQADLSPEEGARAIRRGLELGVNFVDTARTYGTYEHVRLGIEGFQDLVLASKSPVADYPSMRRDVEDCLRALGRESIEIFHLHIVRGREDFARREGALKALVEAKAAGKIQAIGLSSHGLEGISCCLDAEEIDVVYPLVNRTGIGLADGTVEELLALLKKLKADGRGLYDMKALGGGHLLDDIPGAISWVQELELFDSISVGLKTPEEAEAMVGLFEGGEAAVERARRMGAERAGSKRLMVYDWCKRCGICVDSCAQGALSMGEKKAVVDAERCVLCGYCAAACPDFVIRVI